MPEQHDAAAIVDLLDAAVAALGGARRDGQVAMAKAVGTAIDKQRHLAVQAGTGTGKSLGYLVPALHYTSSNEPSLADGESDRRVIVSTATLALQRQLIERDLPTLTKALADKLPQVPKFAILKGRNNYLCLRKVKEAAEAPEGDALIEPGQLSRLAQEAVRLHEWADETEDGDRDRLEVGVSDRAWRGVSTSSRECVGASQCPFGSECFAEKARNKAYEADVVVTNHALLAIDAMSPNNVLPTHDVVIVDEAHELEDRVTGVATAELSPATIAPLAKLAGKKGSTAAADSLREAGDALGEQLNELNETWIGRWKELPDSVTAAIVELNSAAGLMLLDLGGQRQEVSPESGPADPDLMLALAGLEEVVSACDRLLEGFTIPDGREIPFDVVWMTDPDKGSRTLYVAPLSVSGLLRTNLFDECTTVLTSATLAIGGKFEAMATRWGLSPREFTAMDVGSPFDYGKQGILCVAKDLPRPSRDGTSPEAFDAMEKLIMAAGGRTLGLFTSRRAAEAAAEEMRGRLPFDILVQGEDSTGALVDRFAASENICLFGTLSFWQGVDVPGKSLSLVIIDKIPFPRPDDPLMSARQEAADLNKPRSGFMAVSASHAALLLAQGVGRLLRATDDRGVVAILDSRVATARYGSFLLASIPPMWQTGSVDVAVNALQRLVSAGRNRQ
ncbi:ATP-dependent DNA helicase [Corynebacterium ulceribovis]|uniref:ATP-dependent DNA helicase n=1 Tax=Corynebacterium ulceribovis TaxID=487732 RepID=UPI0003711EB4|nr:ATP-dependent DNA helicase [Corynebacterium ulceribovis]